MRKTAKIWLIIAAALVVIGLILFATIMSVYHWDFSKLSTEKYETNTYEISEEFGEIKINTDTADVFFAASEDDTCTVVCYEKKNAAHCVDVQNGTLFITSEDNREWYEYFNISFQSPKITVYLPQDEYSALVIEEATGNVEISKDFRFEDVSISVSTGDVKFFASVIGTMKIESTTGDILVKGVEAETLELFASTGDIELENVIAKGTISIKSSTGDIELDGCDASGLFIKTSTGDVTGSLLTEKVFITDSSTGEISVPKTTTGATCEITTSTGDINIIIKG